MKGSVLAGANTNKKFFFGPYLFFKLFRNKRKGLSVLKEERNVYIEREKKSKVKCEGPKAILAGL